VRVSVVVPTYRRSGLLARCLEALGRQNLDPSAFEVIVADNAADAPTRALVEGWPAAAGPRLRYLEAAGGRGPAFARNAGWRAAAAEVVAFTDDDCVPEPAWLREGLAALGGAAAACGRVVVPLPPAPTDYERNEAGLERAEFVTANCFCRRDALEAVGGFDERFTAAWREDSDLHFALLERGLTVARAPAAVLVHPVRPGRWGVSLGQQRKSQFNALLYRKHPALYRRRIQAGAPWSSYAAVAALAAALGGAAAGRPGLALAATAAWVFLTARFCARRLRGTSHAPGHVAEMLVTSALVPPLSVYWRLRGALQFRVFFL
jgi:GT2 family glycosyltransferase